MQGISLPIEVLNKIDQIMYKFIWKKQFTEKRLLKKWKEQLSMQTLNQVD